MSYLSTNDPFGAFGGYSFGVSDGDGKCGVGTRKIHLYSQKFDLGRYKYGKISVITQHSPRIYLSVGIIKLVMIVVLTYVLHLVTVKVVWVLGPPTFPPIKLVVGFMVLILCHRGVVCIQYHFK